MESSPGATPTCCCKPFPTVCTPLGKCPRGRGGEGRGEGGEGRGGEREGRGGERQSKKLRAGPHNKGHLGPNQHTILLGSQMLTHTALYIRPSLIRIAWDQHLFRLVK